MMSPLPSLLIAEGDVVKATVFLACLAFLLLASVALFFLAVRAQKVYKNEALPPLAPEGLGEVSSEGFSHELSNEEGGFSLPPMDIFGSMEEGDEQANELLRAAHRTQAAASQEEAKAKDATRRFFRRKE